MTLGLISAGLLLTAVTVIRCVSPGPAVMPVRLIVCWAWLLAFCSRIDAGLGMTLIVGAWLTGRIVTVKVRETELTPALAVPPLSVTVTVITAVPLALGVGFRASRAVASGLV